MNFDKTDDCEHDDDYGHFCVLEESPYVSNYHQKIYIQNNRLITVHNYHKPSLYPADYYHGDSHHITISAAAAGENLKTEMIHMSNPHRNHKNDDDDDSNKGSRDKILISLIEMCIFSMFVSAVVIIMTMN
jgi:hypothetical protein